MSVGPRRAGAERSSASTRWWVSRLAVVALLAATASCSDGSSTSVEADEASTAASAVDVDTWCESMLAARRTLRAPYAEQFAESPNGDATPSSALLSLDGSVESVDALRSYLEGLSVGVPESLQVLVDGAVAKLDELSAELSARPGEPGRSAIAGMSIVATLVELDEFAVDNCGTTF